MKACLSCGGRYDPIQADGTAYYHACPPIVRVQVRRAAAELLLERDKVRDTDVQLGTVFVERPDARDENVRVDPVDGQAKPKAEGRGVTDV